MSSERAGRVRAAVVAAVVVTAVIAVPATAAVVNSDTVDGKHAVGAGASVQKRAGKLVATDSAGVLPNDIIRKAPNADKLDGLHAADLVTRQMQPEPGWGQGTPRVLTADWQLVSDLSGMGQEIVAPDDGVIVYTVGTAFDASEEGGWVEFQVDVNGEPIATGAWDPGDADGFPDQRQNFTGAVTVEKGTLDMGLSLREHEVTNFSTIEMQNITAVFYPYGPNS